MTGGLELLHSPDWGTDSAASRAGRSILKDYKPHIMLDDIHGYHSIHKRQSQGQLIIPVGGELRFWGTSENENIGFVEEIRVKVLDLSQSEVTGEDGSVTVKTDFIPGNTIGQFIGIWGMIEPRKPIYGTLEAHLVEQLGVHQLDWRNVKTSDIKDGVVHWIVTDLACSIHSLLESQK